MQFIYSFIAVESGELIGDASGFSNERVQALACEKQKFSMEEVEEALFCEENPCCF